MNSEAIDKTKDKRQKTKKSGAVKWFGIVAAVAVFLIFVLIGLKQGWFAGKEPGVVTMQDMKDASWQQLTDLEKKRIETLLKEADNLFVTDRLVEPKGNNAYELYKKVLEIHPSNKYALAQLDLIRKDFFKRGKLEFDNGNYDGALTIASTGLSYFNGDGELLQLQKQSKIKILENKARQLAQKKQYIAPEQNNAYAVCQELLQLDASNAVARQVLNEIENWFAERGKKAEQQKNWAQAAGIYSQALNYFKQNETFKQQLTAAQQVIQQQQFRSRIDRMLNRAQSLLTNGQYKLAWQKYNEVLALSPGDKKNILNKLEQQAKQALNEQQYGRATELYRLLNKLQPTSMYAKKAAEAERQKWLNWIDWVWVEGGSFEMGCTSEQSGCDNDEKPVHTVTVDGFYMSKYEVTNRQYIEFLNAVGLNKNGSYGGREYIDMDDSDCAIGYRNGRFYFKGSSVAPTADCPVVEVSWYGAVAFCEWMKKKTGTTIRLPTEAEWEYAARGGKKSRGYKYAGSNNVDAVAWYWGNSGKKTHPVGQKQPNELGLYDMSGNVWEWCLDWYDSDYYSKSPRHNPRGPSSGSVRVSRGGGWSLNARYVRVANRDYYTPSGSYYYLGFRLLRTR